MVVVMPLGHAIQSFWTGPAKSALSTGALRFFAASQDSLILSFAGSPG